MPPYDNVQPTVAVCAVCGSPFQTKRPELAKYCSGRCHDKARSPRKRDAATEAARRRRLLSDPATRQRYNEVLRKHSRRVKNWLNAYKLERGCIDCGYKEHAAALDIDHMSGKTANVSQLKSIKAIVAEIERHDCVVRCSNCHRIKSWKTKTWLGRQITSPADYSRSGSQTLF